MKLITNIFLFSFVLTLFLSGSEAVRAISAVPLNKNESKPNYAQNRLIVKYKTGQNPHEIKDPQKKINLDLFLSENGIIKTRKMNLDNFYLQETNGKKSIEMVLQNLKLRTEVESVEYDSFRYSLQVSPPNDPYFSYMWNLTKLQILNAWSITRGLNTVKVAVIDTGVDYNHPDFSGRTFVNKYDFSTCALFDDYGNCLTPKSRDSDPMDDNGHGTHVTGTIGAVVNNGAGISGINWNISLMPLKALSSDGGGYLSDVTDAIKYAADNGAKVINMSLGGAAVCYSGSIEQQAINYAVSKGAVVIVAAGNDDSDAANYSPAGCSNVVAVAAVSPVDERSYYSNYGSVVDLAAPGGDDTPCLNNPTQSCFLANLITSTYLSSQYAFAEGTSMATPHVSGTAALLFALNNSLTPSQIETILKTNVDPVSTDTGKTIGTGRVNAHKALLSLSPVSPTPTTIPSITPTQGPTPTPGDIGLSISPDSVNVTIPPGGEKAVFTITNTFGSTIIFSFNGYPTTYGPGINWYYASGGMAAGQSIVQKIEVNSNIPLGNYQGTGILNNLTNGESLSIPVTVVVGYLPADINSDGKINLSDALAVFKAWLTAGTGTFNYREDINKDGKTNSFDLSQVLKDWGL